MNQQPHYRFVCNDKCEYFPCHPGADPEQFNCLFCYCPLYVLDGDCGGSFRYTKDGVKDCSACLLPHSPDGYDHIMAHSGKILDVMRRHRVQKTE